MHTVGLYTLGCKVSQYETEAVAEAFWARGFQVLDFSSVCDVYVINTCTVTEESDKKSRKVIRRAIRQNPDAAVIVIGCYTERSGEEALAISGVSAIIGTHGKMRAPELAMGLLSGKISAPYDARVSLAGADFEKMTVKSAPRTRAYVKIEDGCDSKCSYCAIKEARGAVRSKLPHEVISEVEALAESGTLEVVLTGVETAAYGKDFSDGYNLAALLSDLDRRRSCGRIRLGSLAPELMGKPFAEAVRSLEILVPHFHVSMQSGSDRVLAAMRRKYNTEVAYENLMRLKEINPAVTFTADFIVGFPAESDEDFEKTKEFISRVGFLDAHIFTFSKRRGTLAYGMQDLPKEIKHKRCTELIEYKNRVRDSVLDAIVASARPLPSIFETKAENSYTAHSDTFVEIVTESARDIRGECHKVLPLFHRDGVIHGKIIE